ncbi:hypothetical protein [Nocardioides sp. SYSU D00038]|uniref:hypothetical protein n=1 Tax=Nocardioides sp. SYSU D00038 TaxID=2812554 RepID=UPI001967960A|nr:hypothetical protein [Nocardioides sp. SYSU D00038]
MSATTPAPGSDRSPAPWSTSSVLLVLGACVMAVALVCFVAAAVATSRGHDWPPEATVPVDGQPHQVAVSADREAFLWAEVGPEPSCAVTGEHAEVLELETTDGAYRRAAVGTEHVAIRSFRPTSSSVYVECVRTGEPYAVVFVEPVPRLPPFLANGDWLFVLPAGLALVATGLVLVATVLVARQRRRPAA